MLDYCRRSANPVGRLVLRLAGRSTPGADRQSDAVCTALQLTNFWQDLAVDWSRGRLYMPRAEWDAAGADPADLDARIMTPAWRQALAAAARRTRALFDDGRGVCDVLSGRLRYELRATWLGGMRILDRLEAEGFDVFRHRPTLGSRRRIGDRVESLELEGSALALRHGPRHVVLLRVSDAPAGKAERHRGGLGLLPRG